jgi:hypothetical protein
MVCSCMRCSELKIQGPGLTHAALEGGCEVELAVVDTGRHVRTGILTRDKLAWDEYVGQSLTTEEGGLAFSGGTEIFPRLYFVGYGTVEAGSDDEASCDGHGYDCDCQDCHDNWPIELSLSFSVSRKLGRSYCLDLMTQQPPPHR